VQLHRARALRQHLAHGQAIGDLLEHEAREHGEDLQLDAVAELVHRVKQARIGQPVLLLLGADALIAIGGAAGVVGPRDGGAGVVTPVGAHQHAAALSESGDAERAEERVQQARVIGVLHVLDVQLPVVGQRLHEAAHHPQRAAQHPAHAPQHLVAEIGLERRGVGREAREDEAVQRRGAQLARPMVGLAEGPRHAPASVRSLLERDADQGALEVVAPGVVHALEVAAGVAAVVERDQRAAMGATVLEGVDRAPGSAHHDDRHLADEGGAVVTGLLHVGLETDVAPGGAFEDAAQLRAVVALVLVDPVRHPRQ
jgi:hypothetical protein